MTRKSKQRNRSKSRTIGPQESPGSDSSSRSAAASTQFKWAWQQIGQLDYAFFVVCVVAQLITIGISWPVWQVRSMPPNLPWLESMPQMPFGILLVVSLVATLLSPRQWGLGIHLAILAVAMFADQFRIQPQVMSLAFLMSACVWPTARRLCIWYLITMWLWAGIHKVVSPEWMGPVSYQLISRVQLDPVRLHLVFAIGVAISEIVTGILAWWRPKLGAIACVGLHLGIALFLITMNWNYSVLPWNFCTAIVGGWILWGARGDTVEPRRPVAAWERVVVVALFVIPLGFYFGWVRHGFAHVLYSGNLPSGLITHRNQLEPLEAWVELNVPFPNVQKTYRDYFVRTATVGEKLHIHDPRPGLKSQYFELVGVGKLKEISADEFFETRHGSVAGVAEDDPVKSYWLEIAQVQMLRRTPDSKIYAVRFLPEHFKPEQLAWLDGLPNLEQIQLAECPVNDLDLRSLSKLKNLMGLGMSNTPITDEGLQYLKDLPRLEIIESEGTSITPAGLERLGHVGN